MTSDCHVLFGRRQWLGGQFRPRSHSPEAPALRHGRQQAAQPHDVVGRRREGEDPVDERAAAVAQLAQAADGLHPAEALLDQLPFLLTDRVAGMPRRAGVDRAAPSRSRVLRDVRRDVHRPQRRRRSRACRSPCRRRR